MDRNKRKNPFPSGELCKFVLSWYFCYTPTPIVEPALVEGAWQTSRLASAIYPKAEVLNRFIGKFVDVILAVAAGKLLLPVGWLAGLAYILICDGFSGGRSIGKRLTGLQTVNVRSRQLAGFKESIVRNLPLGLAYLLFSVPYIGWIIASAIVTLEGLLVIGNEQGLRLGDEIAHTQVLNGGELDVRD